MGIKAIKKRRVSDEVFDQIKDQIISGKWAPGEKIPGELWLSTHLNVSRVSVREAIHRLVGMGVLHIRRGEGTFISEVLPKDYVNTLLPILMVEGADLLEMLEFRSMIESEAVRLACRRAKDEDIDKLKGILAEMKESRGNKAKFALEDLSFHFYLAFATHNSVIVRVNAIIQDMLKKAMDEIVDLTGYDYGIYYHEKILDAIIKRDEDLAAAYMREHIEVTIKNVKAGCIGVEKSAENQ